jgi:hypothetical protein
MRSTKALSVLVVLAGIVNAQTSPASAVRRDGSAAGPGDLRLNVIVDGTHNLSSDGKGAYRTGVDGVAAWLDLTRWPQMSFDICIDWPFANHPGANAATAPKPAGVPGSRTLVHRMTDPVPGGGGEPLGVFDGRHGNDVAISKPVTPTVRSFLDMAIGSSLSPDSATVRFCNSDCSEFYNLVFGGRSLFDKDTSINGVGTTRPSITRTSERTWTISFRPKTVGRLWKGTSRDPVKRDVGLYYYEGNLQLERQ